MSVIYIYLSTRSLSSQVDFVEILPLQKSKIDGPALGIKQCRTEVGMHLTSDKLQVSVIKTVTSLGLVHDSS